MIPIKCLLVFLILVTLNACNQPSKQEGVSQVIAYSPDSSDCAASPEWFAMVNGQRLTPAPNEGPTSVFANNATVTNCDFHQWSWQKFLWLTNNINGKPLFQDSLFQVTAEGTKVEGGNGVILRDTAQASSITDILVTNKNFSASQRPATVYYSIHMNHLLYDTMVKYAPIANRAPALVKYVTFPVGALELKISWVDARALSDTTSYFITKGQIKGEPVRIALLGMHVVGIVQNHPEFVWATFEHRDLAPYYNWEQATPTTDAPVVSSSNYPLFASGDTATVENITTDNGIYTNVFSVYQVGVPVEKVTVDSFDVLLYMATSQPGSVNFNNIRVLNEGVKSQLTDIWNNYFYNGSIWINTGGFETTQEQAKALDSLTYNITNSAPGDLTRGSVSVYNLTMETYVQVGFAPTSIHGQTVGNLVNCFSCHNSSSGQNNSPLYFSHVFNGYAKSLEGFTPPQIKQQHVDEIKNYFLKRNQKVK